MTIDTQEVIEELAELEELVEFEEAFDEAMRGIKDAWNKLKIAGEIEEGLILEDYLDADNDVATGYLNDCLLSQT